MRRPAATRWWWLKRMAYLLVATLLLIGILSLIFAEAAGPEADAPAWTNPRTMVVRRVSDIGNSQNAPNFLSNLDCVPLTYRMVGSSNRQNGCFTQTGMGL